MTLQKHEMADITVRTSVADRLHVPEVTLRVPKYADGIIIRGKTYNKENPEETTSLLTIIDHKRYIGIQRLDGEPLQVYNGDRNSRMPERGIFTRPIGGIALVRTGELWTESKLAESDVDDNIGANMFVELVIDIAEYKQAKMIEEQKRAENLAFSSALQYLF